MTDEASKLSFFDKFKELLGSKKHSDIRVGIGLDGIGRGFYAHRNILQLRTMFFEKAIIQRYGSAECKNTVSRVWLHGHNAHSMWRFLSYCYTGGYSHETNKKLNKEYDEYDDEETEISSRHFDVYFLAHILDVPDLKKLVAKKLDTYLTERWVECKVAPRFTSIVRDFYKLGNNDIRNVLVKATKAHMNELVQLEDFKVVLDEIEEYSWALLRWLVNDHKALKAEKPETQEKIARLERGLAGAAPSVDGGLGCER